MGKAAVEMPSHKEPFSGWILVRETAAKIVHTGIVGLGPATFSRRGDSAETSLGAADTSVCATLIRTPCPPACGPLARTNPDKAARN
jgi:hypothetical protein